MKFSLSLQKSQSRAFSLIELLVVIAIIGIISSIVLVSMTSEKSVKEVESAASFANAQIREAQTAALTGRQHIANTTPCAYRIIWGGTAITIAYLYKDSSENCSLSSTISTSTLPSSVLFTGSGSVDFVLPHGAIATNQVVTLQKAGVTKVVCIQTSGRIEVKASASSC